MTEFNWQLRVPFGYYSQYVTLEWLNDWLLEHHHPEYVRRLIGWLHYKNGNVGVGGGWRAGGAQPDQPGFAPEGKSFHQDQKYADGFIGACAVDSVYKDGPDAGTAHDGIAWAEVPRQGTAEAERWGIHANVGVPGNGESWHLQPIEIDGWGSATGNGTHAAPAIVAEYPIPTEHDPVAPVAPPEPEPPTEDDMTVIEAIHRPPRNGKYAKNWWIYTHNGEKRCATLDDFDHHFIPVIEDESDEGDDRWEGLYLSTFHTSAPASP
jgi:hypothetical protein